jgi:putative nucleotidyltransferase with HDIG domain
MNSILFVDDEAKVLEGLRRMLHNLRRQWHMEFAEGGRRALDCLAAEPFDIVVSDMRMPGMDGSQLLAEVMRLYPATVRIILSGQCDRATVLKAVGTAHQFLTKPCDSETLKATVAQACKLRDRLSDDWHKRLVSRVNAVPSLPEHYSRLEAELKSPQASMPRVCELISQDVGMSAKVIQLISTGFFGTPQRISDPFRAASLFDLDSMRVLAASTDVFVPFSVESLQGRPIEMLVEHCLSVARAAKAIALAEGADALLADDAYLAGLLHDIGVLVLAEHLPDRYVAYLNATHSVRMPLWEVERADFCVSHADIGGYLLGLWGFPDPIIDATAWHHSPAASEEWRFSALTAVHAADALIDDEFSRTAAYVDRLDEVYLDRLGLLDRIETWRAICRESVTEGAFA